MSRSLDYSVSSISASSESSDQQLAPTYPETVFHTSSLPSLTSHTLWCRLNHYFFVVAHDIQLSVFCLTFRLLGTLIISYKVMNCRIASLDMCLPQFGDGQKKFFYQTISCREACKVKCLLKILSYLNYNNMQLHIQRKVGAVHDQLDAGFRQSEGYASLCTCM